MNISIARIAFVITVLGVGAVGLFWLHRANDEAQREVIELRRQNEERIAMRAEQERKHVAAQRALAEAESRPTPPASPAFWSPCATTFHCPNRSPR